MIAENEILTIEEVCELLRIGRNTCTKLLAEGALHGYRIGTRVWKIPRSAVFEFVNDQILKSESNI